MESIRLITRYVLCKSVVRDLNRGEEVNPVHSHLSENYKIIRPLQYGQDNTMNMLDMIVANISYLFRYFQISSFSFSI